MPIARLRGVVEDRGPDWVIVGIGGLGGLGLLASVPATTAESLTPGGEAALFTHLHVREDALTLFGFSTREDLVLFELLISVSGVGPRVALGLQSAIGHAQLTASIAAGRADLLRRVPGIGQKTAERIVLELREKVQPPAAGADVEASPPAGPKADPDVVAALIGLGYSQAEASAAAVRLPADGEVELEDRVRQALQFFARP
jgi:Holliday junction DNA helicase RuvA